MGKTLACFLNAIEGRVILLIANEHLYQAPLSHTQLVTLTNCSRSQQPFEN